MDIKLGWDDILIREIPETEVRHWLEPWSGWVHGRVRVVFMSRFGDWFLERPDGNVDELSVLDGTYTTLAGSMTEFMLMVNAPDWQECHLLSELVLQLYRRGVVPGKGECYGFAPHPAVSGRIDVTHCMVVPIGAWQHFCASTHGGAPRNA